MRFLKNSNLFLIRKVIFLRPVILIALSWQLSAQQKNVRFEPNKTSANADLNLSLAPCSRIATKCYTIYAIKGTILSGFSEYTNSYINFIAHHILSPNPVKTLSNDSIHDRQPEQQ